MSNYYEAPTDEVFKEIKDGCIKIWNTYDNTYGYVDEKVNRINKMENISDNAMFMVAMFDQFNVRKLLQAVSKEAREFIQERIG